MAVRGWGVGGRGRLYQDLVAANSCISLALVFWTQEEQVLGVGVSSSGKY